MFEESRGKWLNSSIICFSSNLPPSCQCKLHHIKLPVAVGTKLSEQGEGKRKGKNMIFVHYKVNKSKSVFKFYRKCTTCRVTRPLPPACPEHEGESLGTLNFILGCVTTPKNWWKEHIARKTLISLFPTKSIREGFSSSLRKRRNPISLSCSELPACTCSSCLRWCAVCVWNERFSLQALNLFPGLSGSYQHRFLSGPQWFTVQIVLFFVRDCNRKALLRN